MTITLIRRSERIKNRASTCNSMLRQKKRQGAGTSISSSQCKRNSEIRRPNRGTSSISTLPDDLMIEILSRLPPKPFFRCKTVCKSWLSLSSDALQLNEHLRPTFAGIFYNISCSDVGFANLSHGTDKLEVDGTISALYNYDRLSIIDCCNGFLLIQALNKNALSVNDLYVYNPATGTLLTVFSFSTPDFDHDWIHQTFTLALDPGAYPKFHIICFTSWSDDEEIFSFLDIFSFDQGKCISHKELAHDSMTNFRSKGAFVEGIVYHLTKQNKILSINPSKCSHQVIRPPEMENHSLIEIGQSQGLLHCLSLCDKKGLLSIWVLKSYTRQEWTLKHKLNLDKFYSVLQPCYNVSHICRRIRVFGHFALHPEKDIVFMPLGCDEFVSLDLSTGKGMELGNLGDRFASGYWIYVPCCLI